MRCITKVAHNSVKILWIVGAITDKGSIIISSGFIQQVTISVTYFPIGSPNY